MLCLLCLQCFCFVSFEFFFSFYFLPCLVRVSLFLHVNEKWFEFVCFVCVFDLFWMESNWFVNGMKLVCEWNDIDWNILFVIWILNESRIEMKIKNTQYRNIPFFSLLFCFVFSFVFSLFFCLCGERFSFLFLVLLVVLLVVLLFIFCLVWCVCVYFCAFFLCF